MTGVQTTLGGMNAGGDLIGINVGVIGMLTWEGFEEEEGAELGYYGIRAQNAALLTLHLTDIKIHDRAVGLTAAGVDVRAGSITGISAAAAFVDADQLHGFSASIVNNITEYQRGLTIGIVNIAGELSGVQIGIINIAGNNEGWRRVLPFANWRF
jgi:hypothetical protein